MSKSLFFEAIIKFCLGIILTGVLIFAPAGTLCFPNGILFMTVLFVPILIAGIVMIIKSPHLLEKRLNAKEEQKEQRVSVLLCGIMFVFGFLASGLGFRFSLGVMPIWISFVACAVFVFAYILYARVLFENKYLFRTVRTEEGQKLIDTGLYGVVRHPMYFATVILFISIPFILGSFLSLPFFLFYPFIIATRIKHEEILLEKELCGYGEYKKRVKYRLIPYIW